MTWRDVDLMTDEEITAEIKALNNEIKRSQRKQITYLTIAMILQALAMIVHMVRHVP